MTIPAADGDSLTEDGIFEITVAAALGTALRNLNAGLRAVRGETGETS